MTDNWSKLSRAVPGFVVASAMVAAGCFHRAAESTPPAPRLPVQEVMAPPTGALGQSTPMATPGGPPEGWEPYIDLVAVDSDVRLVLQKIAEIGNLELIIPSSINKTISVQYVHVPVSVALKDVLSRSGLRLGRAAAAPLPFDTVTVFYRLPANVDSMSSEAIMLRFGVSRQMADLIVKSRRPDR